MHEMDANDLTTLTSFNFDLSEADEDDPGVLSKLLSRVRTAVSGGTPSQDDAAGATTPTTTPLTATTSQREWSNKASPTTTAVTDTRPVLFELSSTSSTSSHQDDTPAERTPTHAEETSFSAKHHIYVTSPTPPASHKEPVIISFPPPSTSSSQTSLRSVVVAAANKASSDKNILVASEDSAHPHDNHSSHDHDHDHDHDDAIRAQNLPDDVGADDEEPQAPVSRQSQDTDDHADDVSLVGPPVTKTASIESDSGSIATTFSISSSHSLSRIIARLRGQKIDKAFWMSDEQCKECYKCRKPFKLLRRRHHCRICGQIFCGKCASHTISGKLYKQKGEVRVCNFCYREHHIRDEDSPIFDTAADDLPATLDDSPIIPSQRPPVAAPKMHIPTTAVRQPHNQYGDADATTVALEIPAGMPGSHLSQQHQRSPSFTLGGTLSRSGSLSAADNEKPISGDSEGGLKRLLDAGTSLLKARPRSNTSSSLAFDDTARQSPVPFRSNRGGGMLVADRELSPFMNHVDDDDDESSVGYQLYDLFARPTATTSTNAGPSGSGVRMLSSGSGRTESASVPTMRHLDSAGSDDEAYDLRLRDKRTEELRGHSGSLERSISLRRQSISGRSSRQNSRHIRINTSNLPKPDLNESWSPSPFASPFEDKYLGSPLEHNSIIKSRLMRHRRISAPPPNVELSYGALLHARKMLKQLMKDESFSSISASGKAEWEDIIMNLLLKVTDNVRPDVRAGDDMDIRHYIKIKKVPGGVPSDSFYVKGVMCTKNVAHKKMMHNIAQPRILILMFSLDYSRVEMENQLMSITPVLSQEREHISKLVARIIALRPSLLLVKSTVSRLALECLLEAKIPVVHNVKYGVIEAVARCTQATIVTSVDKLQLGSLSLGYCGSFEIRTLMHEWLPNRRKTFLIFDDCQPDLGGTIVLRGATNETLRLFKRLIDFMVFVVNNLKLETSLLRDSFAKNRSLEQNEQSTERDRSPLIPAATLETESNYEMTNNAADQKDDIIPLDGFIKLYEETALSASQFVVFPLPYLLVKLNETQEKLLQKKAQTKKLDACSSPTRAVFDKQEPVIDAAMDAEYEHLMATKKQLSRAWNVYFHESVDYINPFFHQNLVVLYSNVCTVTTVPCQEPEIRLFEYYCEPSDKTLGAYITDLCQDASQPCSSNMCGHSVMHHYQSYAHGNARINVMIEPFPCPQPGMSEKILMWSYCRKCDCPTPVIHMSENTWNYSFGKFLEISLYQKGVHCRADICPHDIGENHVRYFGYRDLAVRFQYDKIDLLEVAVPPMKLFTLSQVHIDQKEAELKSMRNKINKFYQSMVERNKAFPFDLVHPRKLEACKTELHELSQEIESEKKQALRILQEVYATSAPDDTLTINWVRRILFKRIAVWDVDYANLARRYLQPERELRKITTSHLRKVFPPDMPEEAASGERTKRATEVTDLPLLGTELYSHEDDMGRRDTRLAMQPELSVSPSDPSYLASNDIIPLEEDDTVNEQKKPSLLRPEVRRQLSRKLLQEFQVKFEQEATPGRVRAKSPQSAAMAPSRIPVLHLDHPATSQQKMSPPFYDEPDSTLPANHRTQLSDLAKDHHRRNNLLFVDDSDKAISPLPPLLKRTRASQRHSLQNIQPALKLREDPTRSMKKLLSSRDRNFRSRLPRRKTSMQVYTRVNDLMKEDMENDPVDEPVDYFSPMAPYSNKTVPARPVSSFFTEAEAITGFDMELERHPPPAVDLLEPPPVGVSATDINQRDESGDEDEEEEEDEEDDEGDDDDSIVTKEVPPPEKNSFMKTLTSFLTDSGIANLLPLEYPLQSTEHVFDDSFVVVREDEPSTIIAYTLSCHDYAARLHMMQNPDVDDSADEKSLAQASIAGGSTVDLPSEKGNGTHFVDPTPSDIRETLSRVPPYHMGYTFRGATSKNTKFFIKLFFAEQFDALRRNCGCDESYIASLASCIKWDSSGGKSGSAFLKTKDDRLLMKQVSRFELDAFLDFAPAYFSYMSEAFFRGLPTVLAKIFGFYSIGYKNPATGKSMHMDVVVMENLFYQRNVKKIFDLKGSMRNRHVQSTGKQDEVLLDENLVELIFQSPIFIRAHSKEVIQTSLLNDTLFLQNRNVMDYSLLVGIDEDRQELVIGIVDFIRTFTWDKKLESWVKESGILGGGGMEPTIVSPKQYRRRFRQAMERYFLMVPDEWSLSRQIRAPYAGLFHHHHPQQQQSQQEEVQKQQEMEYIPSPDPLDSSF